ncbi:MAG: LacI family DNA-binding transcriptional regulator [Paracoccaceae bacterium]
MTDASTPAKKRSIRPVAPRSETPPAPPRRVTMTDVALEAGCSQATVSLVLNKAPGVKISAETRARVIKAALKLGYAPPTFAHLEPAPSTAHSDPIGFLVDQLATSPEAVVAIDGARQAAWEDGRIVLTTQTTNDAEMEREAIRVLTRQPLSGIIYMTIFTRRAKLPAELLSLGVPIVLLNCYDGENRLPSVVPAETAGGRTATRHMIDLGHRRIGMITGEPWMEAARDRQKGYRQALAAAAIPFDPDLVRRGNWSASSGYDGTQALLALPRPPTAIFCQNDRMAIGCFEALKEAGLRIPQDMSVVGFDDEEISRHLHPRLTTLILPHRAMGGWAAKRLAAGAGAGAPVELECTLVARDSVAGPRAGESDCIILRRAGR